ncbi:hypothetical protein M8332_06865 (plasmid) [Fructilactobacillus ixorae]|uniref:Bacteriocin immunity protein n=1 Tax=Fructilactobacillus ixorae TaxID=1750535 RepID=A0ABY5C614_9LACO|nr:hypothetical protein [Fructilactobacillus ixorae]USS94002.1 hypothetical protein M8332_06865 [Fructilactobacillus ixorae]
MDETKNHPTPQDIIRNIDIFKDFDNETIDEKIRIARMKAIKDGVDKDALNTAVSAYARHLLLVTYFASNGGITSATTLGQSFQNVDLTKSDPFLDEYNQISSDFGNSGQWKGLFL